MFGYPLWHLPVIHNTGLLLLSVLLGGVVGWERERREHPAGLRTHVLVCVGSTLITIVGNTISNDGRIAAQIVTGIGFLGAGTIIRDSDGTAVRGLTTAASVWATAGIGIAIGYGGLDAQIAAVATVIVLLILTALNSLEDVLNRHRRRQELTLVFRPDADPLASMSRILDLLHKKYVRTRNLSIEKSADSAVVHIQLNLPRHATRDSLTPVMLSDQSIIHCEWKD